MLEVSIIILDEPNRGLDVESTISLKKLMKKFVDRGGDIVLATHDLLIAEELCDIICIIANGGKKAEGKVSDLKNYYKCNTLEEVFMKSSLLSERSRQIEEIIDNI